MAVTLVDAEDGKKFAVGHLQNVVFSRELYVDVVQSDKWAYFRNLFSEPTIQFEKGLYHVNESDVYVMAKLTRTGTSPICIRSIGFFVNFS